jgi:hypothetical protein
VGMMTETLGISEQPWNNGKMEYWNDGTAIDKQ